MRGYKPIVGHPTYFINKAGEVWSTKRSRHIGFVNTHGYRRVNLHTNGNREAPYVHRLVYQHFAGSIPPEGQIHHINDVKDDNRLENLELVTQIENLKHRWN